MTNDQLVKGVALFIIVSSFLMTLIVAGFSLINHPDKMLPTIVIYILGSALGFALHALGVSLGVLSAGASTPPASSPVPPTQGSQLVNPQQATIQLPLTVSSQQPPKQGT